MKKYTKGFTLIELLVVIAIIGILSSVVLVSLNSARSKGKDTRIISTVQQLRTQFESDSNGSTYNNAFVPSGTAIYIGGPSSGSVASTLLTDATNNAPTGYSGSTTIAAGGAAGTNAIVVVTNGVVASSAFTTSVTAYAIYGRLSTGNYFCIDSTGRTNQSATAATAITCP